MSLKLQEIRKLIQADKADVFWLTNHEKSGQPATQYLSGFTGSDSHLLITRSEQYLITDGRYLASAKKETGGCTIIDVSQTQLTEVLKKILSESKSGNVLIDGSVTTFSAIEKIRKAVPGIIIKNINGCLTTIRQIKTSDEIALLKKSAGISCQAFEKFLPFIRTGVTEKWLARKLTELLLECGAESLSFDPIIASGKNSALPHATPTDKKLKSGEFVVIDFGATYKGYVSDMTRTVAIGKIKPKLRAMYEAVLESQLAGCEAIKSGIPASEVDSACRNILKKHKLEKYFTHATGHGIGMEVHELPVISSKQDVPLQINEVITCEPGVYIENLGGVRIEDSLVVGKNGSTNLTSRVEKKLIVL